MLGPIYAIFVERIGGDLLDASLAGGLFALAAGITTYLSGKLSDKMKESELVIVLGYILIAFGFLFYIFADSVIHILVIQVLIGFGEAIYSPAFDAMYTRHMNAKDPATQWALWESMNYFVTAIGAVIGGLIVTWFGFEPIFAIMAMLCFGSAFYIYLLPRKLL